MALFPEGNRLHDGNNFVLITIVLILNSIHKDFRPVICRSLCFFTQLSKTRHEFASIPTVSGLHLAIYSWRHFLFLFDVFNTRVHPLTPNYAFKLNLILNSLKAKRSVLFKPAQICRISLSAKKKKWSQNYSHLFIFFPLSPNQKNIFSTTVSVWTVHHLLLLSSAAKQETDFNIIFPPTPLVPLPQVSRHQQPVLLKATGGEIWDNLSNKEWSSKGCPSFQQLRADLLVRGCAGGSWAALASLGSWSPWWPFALSRHTFMWAHLVGTVLRLNTDLGYMPEGSSKAAQADLGDVPANAQNHTLAWMLGKTTTAFQKNEIGM